MDINERIIKSIINWSIFIGMFIAVGLIQYLDGVL